MEKKISLNLVIDEVEKRVVFAEGDRDFVDVLISFLVMPVGSAVRLAGSKSKVGCMDTLYKSVENLDTKHFNTQFCKRMLLFPPIAYWAYCRSLVVQIDEDATTIYNMCPEYRKHCFWSHFNNVKCSTCGKVMNKITKQPLFSDGSPSNDVGVFLKGMNKYLITDDLQISKMGSISTDDLCKHGIYNARCLREKKVKVGRPEVLNLLNRALLSKTVLSDTFIGKKRRKTTLKIPYFTKQPSDCNEREMAMDLVVNKSKGKFLYALAKDDVVNFLFSFLTFPLALLSKLYNGSSYIGCIDQLMSSAKLLSEEGQLRTTEHSNFLLNPKVSPHYGFKDQILNIEEGQPSISVDSDVVLLAINPKSPFFTTDKGGSFVNGPATFMISDDLEIKPVSISKNLSVMRMRDDIETIPIKIGKNEALKLLHASLTSSTPLSTVFFDELPAKKDEGSSHKFVDGIEELVRLIKK